MTDITWTTEDILAVADIIRTYFVEECPDVDRLLFNQDVEEIAIRVWPVVEARVRQRDETSTDKVEPATDDYIRDGDDSCPDCTCCTRLGCYRGSDSDCPTNSDGMTTSLPTTTNSPRGDRSLKWRTSDEQRTDHRARDPDVRRFDAGPAELRPRRAHLPAGRVDPAPAARRWQGLPADRDRSGGLAGGAAVIDLPEPWQLYPMPPEQVRKIQAHIDAQVERQSAGRAADVAGALANLVRATDPTDPRYEAFREEYGVTLEAAGLVPEEAP
jgi:hypothetical protein